jgi:hypothetical protein
VRQFRNAKAPAASTAYKPFRFTGKIYNETDKALLVAPEDNLLVPRRVWLPRSQCRVVEEGDEFTTFEIPNWLARSRGFFGPDRRRDDQLAGVVAGLFGADRGRR